MSSDVARAAAAALAGELIVLPTDTVYGLGTRPDRPEATARVFEAKRRPAALVIPILVSSTAAAEAIAVLDDRARNLVGELWPGPLTLVLPRTPASVGWYLGDRADTMGVRMPDHPLALDLLERTGPLAVSSANLSGEPTPRVCKDVFDVFGDAVSVYLCEDERIGGRASTVVDLTGADPNLLRGGALELSVLELLR